MMRRNKCLLCTRKCLWSKAVPENQVGGWQSEGWTYLGKLDDGFSLIANQHGCAEADPASAEANIVSMRRAA